MKTPKKSRSEKLSVRTKLTPEQFRTLQGTADAHKFILVGGYYVQNIKLTRALVKAFAKAEKFVLRLHCVLNERYYLTMDLKLTTLRADAMKFAMGFDEPEFKRSFYTEKTGLRFEVEHILKQAIKKDVTPIKEKENG